MLCDLELELVLAPVWHDDPPRVQVWCHDQRRDLVLDHVHNLSFSFQAQGQQTLAIDFYNKTDSDSQPDRGLDKAVIIQSISFFGITDPRFIWVGHYQPQYPEPWASQQRAQGLVLDPVLTNVDRMGWNGRWWLDFDLPIFTWIHNLQNLGWIYR